MEMTLGIISVIRGIQKRNNMEDKMTVEEIMLEIISDWLKKNGFDGLYYDDGDGCGCGIDDLAPCGESPMGCEAAYKQPDGGYSPIKPEVKNANNTNNIKTG